MGMTLPPPSLKYPIYFGASCIFCDSEAVRQSIVGQCAEHAFDSAREWYEWAHAAAEAMDLIGQCQCGEDIGL